MPVGLYSEVAGLNLVPAARNLFFGKYVFEFGFVPKNCNISPESISGWQVNLVNIKLLAPGA